jgi:hypothetical protein
MTGPWVRAAFVAALLGCAKVATLDDLPDAGASLPWILSVDPRPGPVDTAAAFVIEFSTPMDEGQLLAASGRSETVVLSAEADVERVAAAIEHAQLSAHERSLLVAASAEVTSDRRSVTLRPDEPLPAGGWFLLLSPRLKDDQGRHLTAARFAFSVGVAEPGPRRAQLIWPPAGGEAPLNLAVVHAWADSGRVSLVGPQREVLADVDAHGAVDLRLSAALTPGATYALALDGVPDPAQAFFAAACRRTAVPAVQGGAARVTVRDTWVEADLTLDWPVHLTLEVSDARGASFTAATDVQCAPPVCGAQSFVCPASLRIDGLSAASDYALRVAAEDDFGHTLRTAPQAFSTLAALPRVLISEVMISGTAGEYVEILDLGPGAVDLAALGLQGDDGVVRPLIAVEPPLPLVLGPGSRALAVGASFDPALYPAIPRGTPILRASTQRLLGHGLSDTSPPAFGLMLLAPIPIELALFPGSGPRCPAGESLQRDESAPPDADAWWGCGPPGGTPGAPP